ncbi:MAG TPA: type II toxin-antitoxin system VapC family toxin [Gaiellaceae bacterium]
MAAPEVLVCDTSFISHFEQAQRKPERYTHWPSPTLDRIARAVLAVTPFTLGELRAGYLIAGWGPARRAVLENRLAGYVLIPLDEPALADYATLHAHCRSAGVGIDHNDMWIAAIAISQGLELVTCDRAQANLPGVRAIFLPPPL